MWSHLKQHGKWIAISALTWSFAKQLFLAIKLWGLESTLLRNVQLPGTWLFTIIAITGLIDGVVFGACDVAFDKYFGNVRLVKRVLFKTMINLNVGLVLMTLSLPVLIGTTSQSEVILSKLLAISNLFIFAVYFLVVTFLLQFAKHVAAWIQVHDIRQLFLYAGEGVEEDRIFMFLDMRSSTRHAERLDAVKYSMLIRDCFRDMADAAAKNHAELYQYVGDEVVFTWKTCDENFRRSIELYFCFRQILASRREYYYYKYDLAPQFKAGIHHGKVIRVLVNVNRNAIAYHGDTINTAARIQAKCGELDRDILVSAAIVNSLSQRYTARWEGNFQLRGKEHAVNLFSIYEPERAAEYESSVTQTISIKRFGIKAFRNWLNVL